MVKHINCRGYVLDFSSVLIQGILNVTPDSFSDGGLYLAVENAVCHAKQMVMSGADIIDVGGESSRPGSVPVSAEIELNRILPVVRRLVKEIPVPLSIDTYKPEVARACLLEGAHIINDIEGLRDPGMVRLIAEHNVPVILMHMPGTPKTMHKYSGYTSVTKDVKDYLQKQVIVAQQAGIHQILVDPGFGFGKTAEQNYELLDNLDEFTELGPLLIGTSKKSFYAGRKLTGLEVLVKGIHGGAQIVRAHDITLAKKAKEMAGGYV